MFQWKPYINGSQGAECDEHVHSNQSYSFHHPPTDSYKWMIIGLTVPLGILEVIALILFVVLHDKYILLKVCSPTKYFLALFFYFSR